jgi:nucleotide-binding universal stress UspA family protein
MGKIVVGVDGSKGSTEALHFAIDEARLRGAILRAVMAWCTDTMEYSGAGRFGPGGDPNVDKKSAQTELDHILDAVSARASGVRVEGLLSLGQPARVLIDEAQNAELLIVGSRGHGGFAGLLLGSVSHQCALHASCPVVIVHDPK